MKTIYVDVDDVVSRTTETYADTVNEVFGKAVSFEDLTVFDLRASFGLTENEFHYFFDLVHDPDRLMGYAPVEGAVAVLAAWREKGHQIDIVTGRPSSVREATLAWLATHQVPHDSFTMVDKYNRPGNDPAIAISKAEFAARPYDLAVEDSGEMALFLAGEMGVTTALINQPWNRSCPPHEKIVRCRGWDEIRELA